MKLKINLCLSFLSLVCVPVTFISHMQVNDVSTNSNSLIGSPPTGPQDYYNYIYNRTFSIMAADSTYTWRGTGWLFKHLDSSPTDFHYLMFTNWHVQLAMMELSNPKYYFSQVDPETPANTSDNTPAKPSTAAHQQIQAMPFNANNDYIQFSGFNFVGAATYYKGTDDKIYGVDASIADVKFSPTTGSPLYNQLCVLNNTADDDNMLVHFHNGILANSISLYYAGYPGANINKEDYTNPSHTIYYSQWETSTSVINDTNKSWTTSPPPSSGAHSVDKSADQNIAMDDDYVTQRYPYSTTSPMYWLGGGASGSMGLYYNTNNNNYEVAGLYWGMRYVPSEWYQLATLIYNSPGHYDLYSDYLNGKWIPIPGTMSQTTIILISVVSTVAVIGIATVVIIVIMRKTRKH